MTIYCDNCGKEIIKGNTVTNVGNSIDVILFCSTCVKDFS